jgi:F-type H+-transporting ATPase subunit delta
VAFDAGAQHVAGVYAEALIEAAEKTGETESVLEQFDSLIDDLFAAFPKLEAVLASGLISQEERTGILDRALSAQASPLFLNFLKVVASRGRLDVLRAIHREAHNLYDRLRGRVQVEVQTAEPLTGRAMAQLSDQLRKWLGGEPRLVATTDPKLIGGVVLRIGDTVYDGSVMTRLERVRADMVDRSINEIQSRRDRFRTTSGN